MKGIRTAVGAMRATAPATPSPVSRVMLIRSLSGRACQCNCAAKAAGERNKEARMRKKEIHVRLRGGREAKKRRKQCRAETSGIVRNPEKGASRHRGRSKPPSELFGVTASTPAAGEQAWYIPVARHSPAT